MRDFITNIGSLYWWLSVVIVGILINLISAYLKNRLDNKFASLSSWWRKKSEQKKAQRIETLNAMRANPHHQTKMLAIELRHRIRSLLFLIQGLALSALGFVILGRRDLIRPEMKLFLTISGAILVALGLIAIFLAMSDHRRGSDISSLFSELDEEDEPSNNSDAAA